MLERRRGTQFSCQSACLACLDHPQHHTDWKWWLLLVIPILMKQKQEGQILKALHPQIQCEFETIPGYMKSCQKKMHNYPRALYLPWREHPWLSSAGLSVGNFTSFRILRRTLGCGMTSSVSHLSLSPPWTRHSSLSHLTRTETGMMKSGQESKERQVKVLCRVYGNLPSQLS